MPATIVPLDQLADAGAPQGPPPRVRLLSEIGAVREPARLLWNTPRLASAPRGDERVAMLLPGWKAPEASMVPIGTFLARQGHRPCAWGLGRNDGDVEATRDQLIEQVPRLAERSGRAINLIGWSLGGVIAREVARALPGDVHRVVTYGSPVLGGPSHTVGAGVAGPDECARITELQERLDATEPIRVPITAIFTRRDRAVDWRSCIDRSSLDVTMVEVNSTHVGLGIDPDVWSAVADALAA